MSDRDLDVSDHAETRWRQRVGEGCLARSAIRQAAERAVAERPTPRARRLRDPETDAILIVKDGTVVTIVRTESGVQP